ncbi:MAG: 50S ribosomal protein L13 [Candidatus Sumerlaeota bacterium]|nr:50S ribosomal protein L13 [Candidatus Sumerlaeota bacterium]
MSLKHKTTVPRKEDTAHQWYLIDADGQTVGRLAAEIAERLRGKRLPSFTPQCNPNIHIVVINTTQLVFTGDKMRTKAYYHHSGWPGGIKEITAEKLQIKKPGEILRHAVRGMLPHNRLGNALMKNLRLFAHATHKHGVQKPEKLEIKLR